jgi:hypothetical protein
VGESAGNQDLEKRVRSTLPGALSLAMDNCHIQGGPVSTAQEVRKVCGRKYELVFVEAHRKN